MSKNMHVKDRSGKFLRRFGLVEKKFPSAGPAVALAAVVLLLPWTSGAGGVVTSCTEENLRTALTGGGTVTFACDGTITLANTISNLLNTVIDGSGHQITISGGNAVRVFYVATNVNFTVVNLTVANGQSTDGAGVFNDGGELVFTAATF